MEIQWKGSRVFYKKTGHGAKTLLLFHGFGQDHAIFNELIDPVSSIYTCFSFDLFFHGNSHWEHGQKPLTKGEWKTIMTQFLEHEEINEFSVMGFSIGARLALALCESIPTKTRGVFLVAPDGIRNTVWFSLATSSFFSGIFKRTIRKPDLFFSLARITEKTNLVDRNALRFARLQMSSEEKRFRVYHTWMVLREMNFSINRLSRILNTHNIQVKVILGSDDALIKQQTLNTFIAKLKFREIITLNTMHHTMIQTLSKNVDYLITKENGIRP